MEQVAGDRRRAGLREDEAGSGEGKPTAAAGRAIGRKRGGPGRDFGPSRYFGLSQGA